MRALWLWFLRELHKLSMKIALWAKSKADSFDLPAPEQRQAGQPPADWLARVQNASQPPAHWLEYIQSKTGQMPQMQDMGAIAQETAAVPKATLPVIQENPARPSIVKDERPIHWRKSQQKIVTEIDELPVPQSKEAAIISYQSPSSSRVPERLHWRIQKPAGKSVFETLTPSAAQSDSTPPPSPSWRGETDNMNYADLQETSAKPVTYAQPEKPQSKKPRYRLLKRGMRGKVAYQAIENLRQSEATYPALSSQITMNQSEYPAPKPAPKVESVYKAPEASSKAESQFRAPEHPQKADTQFSQLNAFPKAETEYKSPENLSKTQADYAQPKQTANAEINYPETYRDKPEGPVNYKTGENPALQEAKYQGMKSPIVSDAEYPTPKQAKEGEKPSYSEAEKARLAQTQYNGRPDGVSPTNSQYVSPQNPATAQGNYSEGKTGKRDSANYPQAEQSQNSRQTRFVRGNILSDARTALASASNDYWIALPNELNSEEMSAKSHQNRLDAEQRGEF